MSVGVLAVMAAAGTYLWTNYGGLLQTGSSVEGQAAAPNREEIVILDTFQTFQRQTSDSLQSAIQEIGKQKADIKNLSDQVSALTAKIDALQNAATPTPQPVAPTRPPVVAARKKPSAPKTTGGISVGGAPLPAAPPDGQ